MVSAWHNGFYNQPLTNGAKYEDLPMKQTDVRTNGSVVTTNSVTRHTTAWAMRYDPSNNPISPSGWRNPSDYRRTVMRASFTEGSRTTTLSTGTVRTVSGLYRRTDDIRSYLCTWPLSTDYFADSTNAESRARTECLQRMKDQKIDLSTYLAESVKSAGMLADGLSDLTRLLMAIKRGNVQEVVSRGLGLIPSRRVPQSTRVLYKGTRHAGNYYLQYKYGWKPLLGDLATLFELSQKRLERERMLLSSVRVITESYEDSSSVSYWTNRQQSVKVTAKCKFTALLKTEFLDQARQIGLTNPLQTGWELIPWSFVVDWAAPIGNYLASLDAAAGLDFKSGFLSSVATGHTGGNVPYSGTGPLMGVKYEFKSLKRTRLTTFPEPEVYIDRSPFSTSRIGSSIALYRQLLK